MNASALKKLVALRGLSKVPGLIALALWGFSIICLQVDARFPQFAAEKPFTVFYTDDETARRLA
ncbi:MAG: hypothetical protein AAFO61_05165 [Pseudomonadota bacterium]